MADHSLKLYISAAVQLVIGLVGSLLAYWLGLPMPFLLGSLVATGAYAMLTTQRNGKQLEFPSWLRKGFVAVIGVMIGTTFSNDLLAVVPSLWISLVLMVAYVAVSLASGYLLFRYVGRYDRTTAVFSAMPGGLVEAVAFGEQAGGDIRILSLQHFARIVLVVIAVPLLFYIWSGQAVGSAAGQTFSVTPWVAFDVILIAVLAPIGMLIGPWLRLPAPYLTGPLILSALVHATGLTATNNPDWLLYLAQLVVGSGLGANFSGATLKQLVNAFALGLVAVSMMLIISFGFATGVGQLTPLNFDALFISYAPGGVTEMNLIALSLGISPVITATHHLFRILLTSLLSGFLARSKTNPEL